MDYIELYNKNRSFYSKDRLIYKDALDKYYSNLSCKDTSTIEKQKIDNKIEIKCTKTNTFLKIELPQYNNIKFLLNNNKIKKN